MGTVELVGGDTHPDAAEIQQREDLYPVVVPVRLDGPTHAQIMPALPGIANTVYPDTADPSPLVNEDRTRGRLVLWCVTAAVFVGFDKEAVRQGNCARLAAGAAPLEFRHTGRIWVRSDTATSAVSFFTENWTR